NRIVVLFTLVINYILLVSYRIILMKVTQRGMLEIRNVAVVGNGAPTYEFARTIERHDVWGLKLIGVFRREEVRALLESGGVGGETILGGAAGAQLSPTPTFGEGGEKPTRVLPPSPMTRAGWALTQIEPNPRAAK